MPETPSPYQTGIWAFPGMVGTLYNSWPFSHSFSRPASVWFCFWGFCLFVFVCCHTIALLHFTLKAKSPSPSFWALAQHWEIKGLSVALTWLPGLSRASPGCLTLNLHRSSQWRRWCPHPFSVAPLYPFFIPPSKCKQLLGGRRYPLFHLNSMGIFVPWGFLSCLGTRSRTMSLLLAVHCCRHNAHLILLILSHSTRS